MLRVLLIFGVALVAEATLVGCGARQGSKPEHQDGAPWNPRELASKDPLLPNQNRKPEKNEKDAPKGGISPYEQIYTPVPEGGHEEGASPYDSSGGAPGPTGSDNGLAP